VYLIVFIAYCINPKQGFGELKVNGILYSESACVRIYYSCH